MVRSLGPSSDGQQVGHVVGVSAFLREKEAVRILVATEVASEGLNLHDLSHRLVHFDIPWSLMTLQLQIRDRLTASCSEGMGDTGKILRVFDPAAEETEIGKAVEAGDASGLEARMERSLEEVMTIEPAPCLKLVTVLHREPQQ